LVNRVLYTWGRPKVLPAPSIMYLSRIDRWALGWLLLGGEQLVLHLNEENSARWFEISSRGVTPFVLVEGGRWRVEEPNEDLVLELIAGLDESKVRVLDGAEISHRYAHPSVVAGVRCRNKKKYIVYRSPNGEHEQPVEEECGEDYEERRTSYLVLALREIVAVGMLEENQKIADSHIITVGEATSKQRKTQFKIAIATPKKWHTTTGIIATTTTQRRR